MTNANAPKPPEAPKEMDMDLPRIGMRKPAPAPEAPKADDDWSCHVGGCNTPSRCIAARRCVSKPAPAPEPQGSEMQPRCAWEPGTTGVCEAYRSLRAEVDRLKKDAARHEEEEAANCPEDQSCIETIKALRAELAEEKERSKNLQAALAEALVVGQMYDKMVAELAQAREEIANLKERIASMDEDITAFGEADVVLTAICNRERAARERAEARVKELSEAAQAVVDVRPDLPNTLRGEIETLATILARAKEGEPGR